MALDIARYKRRRLRSSITIGLCWAASGLGLTILGVILATLLYKGVAGLNPKVFLEMTPPPGSDGGLSNAIAGSLVMTIIGVFVGTPIGILAGTYLAEYGRYSKVSSVIRFINDILLSAPSIVTGLFIYELLVRPMGHFSAIAGAAALAVLVIPTVVRTTENMLLLVPNTLREASSALGLPQSLVIRHVAYKAARAGMITGVLLAIARVSGETAPLLFTALNNQFWSSDLNAPMASLPVVIFQYALSPYEDWQRLAWTGALLITAAVLTLSIAARWLGSSRSPQ
jgi:phosphate transport system permease protein